MEAIDVLRAQPGSPCRDANQKPYPLVPRAAAEQITEGRVLNWARSNGGGLPGYALSDERECYAVDELDAAVVERAMCEVRRYRPEYYRIVELKYMDGYSDEEASRKLRKPMRSYQDQVARFLVYLGGKLETLDNIVRA